MVVSCSLMVFLLVVIFLSDLSRILLAFCYNFSSSLISLIKIKMLTFHPDGHVPFVDIDSLDLGIVVSCME